MATLKTKIATGGAAVALVAAPLAIAAGASGSASANTALGPATNSCAGDGKASAPVAVAGGIFIPDTASTKVPTGVHVSQFGTGSLNGDLPAKVLSQGLLIPTQGIGIGTLSGSYLKAKGAGTVACQVNGTFLLN